MANMGNGSGLPEVTEEDNGKMPIVQNGEWAIEKPSQYNGAFIVNPTPDGDQVLATKGMYMYLDLVVGEIPYSEVTNAANGTTVTIG